MSIVTIRQAQREGARLVFGLAGQSGDGKTLTALFIAYGLANYDASKVGFLDTENKRGSLYSDALSKPPCIRPTHVPFLIGDLRPPFSPARFAAAIKEFEAAGVEVLVIDSVSHEYEGDGGVLELREPLPGKSGKRDNYAKAEHAKFMKALLQSDMHIICCIRAREKTIIEKDGQGKTVYIPQGVLPIQEKNFKFELTGSLMMSDRGRKHDVLKPPHDELMHLFPGTGYLNADVGKTLRDWVDGAKQLDPVVEKWRNKLIGVCDQGLIHIRDCWNKTPAPIRKSLGDAFQAEIEASASEYDKQREEREAGIGGSENESVNALNQAAAAAATAPKPKASPAPSEAASGPENGPAADPADAEGEPVF